MPLGLCVWRLAPRGKTSTGCLLCVRALALRKLSFIQYPCLFLLTSSQVQHTCASLDRHLLNVRVGASKGHKHAHACTRTQTQNQMVKEQARLHAPV